MLKFNGLKRFYHVHIEGQNNYKSNFIALDDFLPQYKYCSFYFYLSENIAASNTNQLEREVLFLVNHVTMKAFPVC